MKPLPLPILVLVLAAPSGLTAEVHMRPASSLERTAGEAGAPAVETRPAEGLFTALPRRDELSQAFFVPRYFVDASGDDTTLFAVRNDSQDAVQVSFDYFGVDVGDGILHQEDRFLGSREVVTVNLRDVMGLVPGPEGERVGLVRVLAPDDVAAPLAGDFFQVDTSENLATGDRLIGEDDFCDRAEVRFLSGGPLVGGTRFALLIDVPQGADPDIDPPTVTVHLFDESGTPAEIVEIFTDDNSLELLLEDLTDVAFGAAEFDFGATRGAVIATFSALGRFSIGLNATCL